MDDDSEHKKAKRKKKIIKRGLMVKNYKYCLFNDKTILKSQQRFKRDCCHNVCTEEINKIALSSNDDKRLQTFDKITTYPLEQIHSKYAKVRCCYFEEDDKRPLYNR